MISVDPQLSRSPSPGSFLQSLQLADGAQTIANARWHCPSVHQGIVQILELSVTPPHRRQGHAGRLLRELLSQARAHHRNSGARLRHVWVLVEQKEQVVGRAFLTKHGFHHVSTIKDMLTDGDLLVYTLALV